MPCQLSPSLKCQQKTCCVGTIAGTLSIAAIVVCSILFGKKTKTPTPTDPISVDISPNITSPQIKLTLNKTAALPSTQALTKSAAVAATNRIPHFPGDSFRVHPYGIREFFGPDGRGISYFGRGIDISYTIHGPAAGRMCVMLPNGTVYVMYGRFMPIPGSIDAWRFISDCPCQPLSIILDKFSRTFIVTIL